MSCLARAFLTSFLLAPAAKEAELSIPKLSVSISRVSVDGLKLVSLSADFLLNLDGTVMIAITMTTTLKVITIITGSSISSMQRLSLIHCAGMRSI